MPHLFREKKMAIKRLDDNGKYREVDPATGLFIENEYPLASNLGQIEHQIVATSEGRVVDTDAVVSDVIDESTGLAVVSEDEVKIKQFIKEAISIDNLVATFNENSHETLLKLLALQDNKHPLKKGGVNIAYRTDALIMHCKMEFTADENVVFDAILGAMSTYPENTTYRIEPSSFVKYSRYKNSNTIYNTFKKGTDKLKERLLTFEELGPDGEDDIIVPWFNILRYHNKKDKNNSYIEFAPSDFFKDLALCSQLVHGAYGKLEVTTQLQGKYTIALYWYLENMKRYKEYPTATPGIFDMSVEELKHQFSIPEAYKKAEIERRVLRPAMESINSVDECDFTFVYEPRYVDGKHAGYRFEISEKNYIDVKAVEVIEQKETDPMIDQLKTFFSASQIDFSDEEISRIYNCAKRNDKDALYMMQIIPAFKQRLDSTSMEEIEDRVGYFCRMIEQGTSTGNQSKKAQSKPKTGFKNFGERDYSQDDWDKLMEAKFNQ
jgi:plasmid replication initiation protein